MKYVMVLFSLTGSQNGLWVLLCALIVRKLTRCLAPGDLLLTVQRKRSRKDTFISRPLMLMRASINFI